LNNAQNVAFLYCFGPILITSRSQALRAIYIRVPGEPGNEATSLTVRIIGRYIGGGCAQFACIQTLQVLLWVGCSLWFFYPWCSLRTWT